MPRGAAGSSASDKISLLNRLGLMGYAFGHSLAPGLGAPSGEKEAMCAGRPGALQAAFAKMTTEFRSYINAHFSIMIQRAAIDTTVNIINSDLGKWFDAQVQWSQQLYGQNRSPPPTIGVLHFSSVPALPQLRSFIATGGDAVRMVRAGYADASEEVGTGGTIAGGGVGSGSGAGSRGAGGRGTASGDNEQAAAKRVRRSQSCFVFLDFGHCR